MATRRPLATDISQIEQVDPGVFRDTIGGGFYGGTWDNPIYEGDYYYGGGQFGSTPTPPGPAAPPPVAPAPAPTPPPAQATTFLPGGSPTVPATAQATTAAAVSPSTFQSSAATAATAPAQFLGASTSADAIQAYFASRGTTPYPTSVQFWIDHWPELYARGVQLGNPNYAFSRLADADEFKAAATTPTTSTGLPRTTNTTATPTVNGTAFTVRDPSSGATLGQIGSGDVTPYDPGVYVSHDGKYFTTDGKGGAIYLGTDGPAAIAWVKTHGTASGVPGGGSGGGTGGTGGGTGGGGTIIPPGQTTPNLPTGYSPFGPPLDPGLNQAGQDPLSEITNSGLAGLMEMGGTPYGQSVIEALNTVINGGGNLASTLGQRIAARDEEAQGFDAQMSDARAALAERGIADEPGVTQGATATAIDRITRGLGTTYAGKLADIETHAMDLANANVMQALTLATGMSENQAQNVLAAANASTNRQQMLGDIALRTLDQNRQWQQFLANFGLDREKLAYDIQNGNMDDLRALIAQFLDSVKVATGGHI